MHPYKNGMVFIDHISVNLSGVIGFVIAIFRSHLKVKNRKMKIAG